MVDLKRISNNVWEIPKTARSDMNVPVHIYSSDALMEQLDKGVIEQSMNVASLPGLVSNVNVMPDGHWGYGFPIGGVAAMNLDSGVISPGGIGFDINCGMRLIQTNLTYKEVQPKLKDIINQLFDTIPTGIGTKGRTRLTNRQFDEVMTEGVDWIIENGYGWTEDRLFMEENGKLEGARPELISQRARSRGLNQLGTLGSGNHFVELQVAHPENVHDKRTAAAYGIDIDEQVVIMVHSGSRGFGHQIASEYLKKFLEVMPKHGITIKDKELAAAPINSREGSEYFASMAAAANMAFANRSMIMNHVREVFSNVFATDAEDLGMHLTYDVCHNIAKFEEHTVNGHRQKLLVHRKGATRAFAPHHPELATKYQEFGQPVIIGGSMETGSYVLAGTKASMHEAFGSAAHGSGRTMSRTKAKKQVDGKQLQDSMRERGIYVRGASYSGLAEEAGIAYKDLSDVIAVCENAGLARPIVRLNPIGNIKG